jgi:hypothetical protein
LDLLPDVDLLVQNQLLSEVPAVVLLRHVAPSGFSYIVLTGNSAGLPRARTPPTTTHDQSAICARSCSSNTGVTSFGYERIILPTVAGKRSVKFRLRGTNVPLP